ncbi:hypothetical protein PAMC26577_11350 [Caballeronia sordidicola]|uniref:Uncharacterized protein n=1 Tax=Caballeronia sordidicola TaxID=196367 RepID=A0A242MY79_CABSO|nr:hypothetical protein PAMC26577_11350 [Caballeronia sordidicola]
MDMVVAISAMCAASIADRLCAYVERPLCARTGENFEPAKRLPPI